jgi:competence protein ComGC
MAQRGLLGELWDFMRVRKKFWLLPMLIVLLTLGALLVFAQGSALAPFIYSIF